MLFALVDILFWMVCIAMATIGVSCIIVGIYYCWRGCRRLDNHTQQILQ